MKYSARQNDGAVGVRCSGVELAGVRSDKLQNSSQHRMAGLAAHFDTTKAARWLREISRVWLESRCRKITVLAVVIELCPLAISADGELQATE